MIWPLILAGGIVALAFFLLMDIATQPARERTGSIRRAAGDDEKPEHVST